MKKKAFIRYILALSMVLSLLPLLCSAQSFLRLDSPHQNRLKYYDTLPCDAEHIAVIAAAERILPTSHIRLTRCDPLHDQYQPRSSDRCFKGNSWSFFTAGLLYIIIYYVIRKLCFSRRYIIKYVHDQDGHKITAPFNSDVNKN
ncbi:hypothetical protein [Ruminococcus flavefaciens]|uniref:hypothetical protein n=1 Tax=Ruminococcus flavefaciens TaxID=1265 RepID=UPI00048E300D|nr:hypothetical protein [Ruminococcus flavefaciens]